MPDTLKDLELLVRSRYGLILLETEEEERAQALLRHLADQLRLAFFVWTPTKGLRRDGEPMAVYGSLSLPGALDHVESSTLPSLYCVQGAGEQLRESIVGAKLKDAAEELQGSAGAVVLTGLGLELPEPLRPLAARVALAPPSLEEFRSLLRATLDSVPPSRSTLSPEEENRLLSNLKGLTLLEARKALTKAIVEDGKLEAADIESVLAAKKEIVQRDGLLEFTPASERLADIADLKGLKSWLAKRRQILDQPEKAQEFGLSFPKGVLLLGVQGCGKSLCARAVAAEWGLPLLKFDPCALYNKYIGESEKNFSRAVKTAERVAPVVLWIDEIEKAFADAGDQDGGVSQRILGTFLGWLQERKGDVFVVATANNIAKLPPEFIRKGRFDEIFFVDLPDAEARADIFNIHLAKRGRDPSAFDLGPLVSATEGFSGAEIEQVVVSALYTAFQDGAPLSPAMLLSEAAATRPLSQTMFEKMAELRDWARERTVSAQ